MKVADNYYQYLFDGDIQKFDTERKKSIPSTLCKFVSLGNNKCENRKRFKTLANEKIWISPADSMNDPFEFSAMTIDEKGLIDAGIPKKIVRQVKEQINQNLRDAIGISSLSDHGNQSMAMWGYYANGFQGFCVEYDVIDPKVIYQVSYEPNRISIQRLITEVTKVAAMVEEGNTERIADFDNLTPREALDRDYKILSFQLVMKHVSWSHENEYRVLFPLDGGPLYENYDGKTPGKGWNVELKHVGLKTSRIIIGINCDTKNKKTLKAISEKLGVDCYQQVISQDSFWKEEKI